VRAFCACLAHLATRQVPSGQKSVFVQLGAAVLLRLVAGYSYGGSRFKMYTVWRALAPSLSTSLSGLYVTTINEFLAFALLVFRGEELLISTSRLLMADECFCAHSSIP